MGKDDGGSGAGKSEDGAQNEKEKMKMGTNDQWRNSWNYPNER